MVAVALVVALGTPLAASADDGRVGLGVEAGTLGIGPALNVHVMDGVDLHVINGNYTIYRKTSSNSVNFDDTIHLGGTLGYVDFAPLNGPIRIGVGALGNNGRLSATARPNSNGTYTFNGQTYPVALVGNVTGTVTFPEIAPYVGLGFAPYHYSSHTGLSVFGNAGVAFSAPVTTLVASNSAILAADPNFQKNLNTEKKTIERAVGFLRTYPVVGVGVQYRF